MTKISEVEQHERRKAKGQSLVEYALILVLVALVAIVLLNAVGNGNSRVFGVVEGALGAHYNALGDHYIEIDTALCIAKQAENILGIYVVGLTNEQPADLTGSTDLAVGTAIGGLSAPITMNGQFGAFNGFKWSYQLDNVADRTHCPSSVVIQAKDGTTAFAQIQKEAHP